ncbi:aminoacyl-tRNA hydrolase [Collinsella bouchesdurhonensis]|uniref:aminoacyl-tRNA hydrolase n=1 Tax=Collinsella bouchesdurhonensis TaxID=1907654 RepID=UPI0014857C36|nr:aminoacyl-tRNA hydrolase [Collinsella bouchesdurhonensis]
MAAAQPQKIRMIAGLGNPGEEYAQTRHNAGFKAIDELARQANVTYWKNQAGAEVASIKVNDAEAEGGKREVILVKPQSYMNTSGGPISKLCAQYKVSVEELLVIHDELDIPAGDVRIKVGGGHAGHNGLRSIIDKMGSRDFSRVRVGIGNPPGRMPVADFVLKQLRSREAEDFDETTIRAAEAAATALTRGVIFARDHVNGAAASNGKH